MFWEWLNTVSKNITVRMQMYLMICLLSVFSSTFKNRYFSPCSSFDIKKFLILIVKKENTILMSVYEFVMKKPVHVECIFITNCDPPCRGTLVDSILGTLELFVLQCFTTLSDSTKIAVKTWGWFSTAGMECYPASNLPPFAQSSIQRMCSGNER